MLSRTALMGLVAGVSLFLVACGRNNDSKVRSENIVWNPVSKESPTCCSITLKQSSNSEFRIEVKNNGETNVFFPIYYFGFTLAVVYDPGDEKQFDYGADKVPAPSDGDWHVLGPQESIAWDVTLPQAFPPLSRASEVTYGQSNSLPTPPNWILKLSDRGDQVRIYGKWRR